MEKKAEWGLLSNVTKQFTEECGKMISAWNDKNFCHEIKYWNFFSLEYIQSKIEAELVFMFFLPFN